MEYTGIFKALSDSTRLRVMYVLLKAKRELCICELMDSIGIRAYHASRCMRELKIAGLVRERKDGKFVFYRIDDIAGNFRGMIYKLVLSLPENEFREDLTRMRKRINGRKKGEGRCLQETE